MEHVARRPLLAATALTTAAALALTPITIAPPEVHMPSISAAAISTQAVHLTDAWSSLFTDTFTSVSHLGGLLVGADPTFSSLPTPTIFLAPIATQLVLNQIIYVSQVLSGHAGQIPGEIATHLKSIGEIGGLLSEQIPPLIALQLQVPFTAIQAATTEISTATNPLIGLLEAPAAFLDVALNSDYGFLGGLGPIGFPIIVRNALAKAIDPPLPAWLSHLLQPAKPAAATALTSKVAASSRSTSKSSAATSGSPKANHHSARVGHSKRK